MLSKEAFVEIISTMNNSFTYLTCAELSYLENLVRESSVSKQKVHNYIAKGYIAHELLDGKKVVSVKEAEKYLTHVVTIKTSRVKDIFAKFDTSN